MWAKCRGSSLRGGVVLVLVRRPCSVVYQAEPGGALPFTLSSHRSQYCCVAVQSTPVDVFWDASVHPVELATREQVYPLHHGIFSEHR